MDGRIARKGGNSMKKRFLSVVFFILMLMGVLFVFGCTHFPIDPIPRPVNKGANLFVKVEPRVVYRVYEKNKYLWTGVGQSFWWLDLTPMMRARGVVNTHEFVFIADGYLPVRKQYTLELKPPEKENYIFNDLVILERDPNAPRNNVTVKQEEFFLDEFSKMEQPGGIIQSLEPSEYWIPLNDED